MRQPLRLPLSFSPLCRAKAFSSSTLQKKVEMAASEGQTLLSCIVNIG